jgi:hypothetical protein
MDQSQSQPMILWTQTSCKHMYDVVAFGMMTASGLHSIQMNTRDPTYLLNAAYLEKPWLDCVVQNLQSA